MALLYLISTWSISVIVLLFIACLIRLVIQYNAHQHTILPFSSNWPFGGWFDIRTLIPITHHTTHTHTTALFAHVFSSNLSVWWDFDVLWCYHNCHFKRVQDQVHSAHCSPFSHTTLYFPWGAHSEEWQSKPASQPITHWKAPCLHSHPALSSSFNVS